MNEEQITPEFKKRIEKYQEMKRHNIKSFVEENFPKLSDKEKEKMALRIEAIISDFTETMRDDLHQDYCHCAICNHNRWIDSIDD